MYKNCEIIMCVSTSLYFLCRFVQEEHIYTNTYTYIHTDIGICINTHIYIGTCINTYMYKNAYTGVYQHTHIIFSWDRVSVYSLG